MDGHGRKAVELGDEFGEPRAEGGAGTGAVKLQVVRCMKNEQRALRGCRAAATAALCPACRAVKLGEHVREGQCVLVGEEAIVHKHFEAFVGVHKDDGCGGVIR